MKRWSSEELEALEWLVDKKASLEGLELVLEGKTATGIIKKIRYFDNESFRFYKKRYYQRPEIKEFYREHYKKSKELIK